MKIMRGGGAAIGSILAAAVVFAQGPRQVALVITNAIVVTVDPAARLIAPGAVAIDGTDIIAVGTAADIRRQFRARETIDASGQVVMPGLVNTHTHAPMVLFRGLADDLALEEWLTRYIFPAEAKTVSPEFVRAGTRLAVLEMIESGTTTYADMYYFEEEVAKETKAAGLRGVLGETIIQFPVADAKTPAEALARAEAFIKMFRNDPLITPAVAPHAIYTNDSATLKAARALSMKYGVPTLIHMAETQSEAMIAKERGWPTVVSYLDALGFLGPGVLGAHAVWVNDSDIALLKSRGAGVSHNPESNMKLASGIAPVKAYLAADVAIGLGTDGAASNNDLDMFEAMRAASFLQKVATSDPTAVSAKAAIRMATMGGARALGMDKRIGSLEPGKRADIIIVSMSAARQAPMYDARSHLVYVTRGDDVQMTIVNGKVLMRNRKVLTLDRASILRETKTWAAKVSAAVAR
jgi:5-methylthioadenosine/S-adenosylhomocysteine deaminase